MSRAIGRPARAEAKGGRCAAQDACVEHLKARALIELARGQAAPRRGGVEWGASASLFSGLVCCDPLRLCCPTGGSAGSAAVCRGLRRGASLRTSRRRAGDRTTGGTSRDQLQRWLVSTGAWWDEVSTRWREDVSTRRRGRWRRWNDDSSGSGLDSVDERVKVRSVRTSSPRRRVFAWSSCIGAEARCRLFWPQGCRQFSWQQLSIGGHASCRMEGGPWRAA